MEHHGVFFRMCISQNLTFPFSNLRISKYSYTYPIHEKNDVPGAIDL